MDIFHQNYIILEPVHYQVELAAMKNFNISSMPFIKTTVFRFLLGAAAAAVFFILLYQLPAVNSRLAWRFDAAFTRIRVMFNPIGEMPTPDQAANPTVPAVTMMTPTPVKPTITPQVSTAVPTAVNTPLPSPTPTQAPDRVVLQAPRYEQQDWNSCGPVALSMYLNYYGWGGDQFDISDQIKTIKADRNVNIDELIYFVTGNVGWLNTLYRVDGSIEMLQQFIAAGIPVVVEESFLLNERYWNNDDLWSGHYRLVTGYDRTSEIFIVQDSFVGPDRIVTFDELDRNWQAFNRVFLLVYEPEDEQTVLNILGDNWDVDTNRQNALQTAELETEADPENGFTWFNLGTNLTYFQRYSDAAQAYDTAREVGLPQRMLRYQFGPFLAYFHSNRNEDLLAITDYALKVTANSEEALLWRGWALYRAGNREEAMASFTAALEARPGYPDANYAINFLLTN